MNTYYIEHQDGMQMKVKATDEKMAKAYLERDDNLVSLAERDKSKKLVRYSQDHMVGTEEFLGIHNIKKAKNFIDANLGIEYEVNGDDIIFFEMSLYEYKMFYAYLDGHDLW